MELTFEFAMMEKRLLEWQHEAATNDLKAISGNVRGPMGLTPDTIKRTPEWKAAYSKERSAFNAMRNFNMYIARTFKKELRAEREAKRQLTKYKAI